MGAKRGKPCTNIVVEKGMAERLSLSSAVPGDKRMAKKGRLQRCLGLALQRLITERQRTAATSSRDDPRPLFEPVLPQLGQADAFHDALGQGKNDALLTFEMPPGMGYDSQ